MDTELSQGLTFLTWAAAGFIIVIGVFLAKLLFDLSRLTLSIKKSTDIVHTELSPIMKNLNETSNTINTFVQATNKKVGKITEAYDKASEIVSNTVSKAAEVSGIVLKELGKGLLSGFKMMFNKK